MTRMAIFPVMAGRAGGEPLTYERELIRNLAELDTETDYHITCLNQAAIEAIDPKGDNFSTHIIPGMVRPLAMSVGLNHVLRREKIDLMHAAYMAPPWCGTPYIFTLHCSSPFLTPHLYEPAMRARLQYLIRCGIRDARHVICVSNDVLQGARDYYGISEDRMSVVHNGVAEHFRTTTEQERAPVLAKYGLDGSYLFIAAAFEKRKNLSRLLEAFALYRREVDPECKLALAGDRQLLDSGARLPLAGDVRPVTQPLAERIRDLGLEDAVVRLGYVPQEDLAPLYGGAVFFAFPSLWEGFGIPVIEAMACGVPVLTSNTSALPEVTNGAAVLVNPASVSSIAEGMATLAKDRQLRDKLVAAGIRRAAEFSWKRCARETLEVYRRMA